MNISFWLPQTISDIKSVFVYLLLSFLKIFIGMLAYSFFTESLTGSYTKSTITQIERRFDISTSTVGVIDGSFEMGELRFVNMQ